MSQTTERPRFGMHLKLFQFMHDNYNVLLLESEMDEIENIVVDGLAECGWRFADNAARWRFADNTAPGRDVYITGCGKRVAITRPPGEQHYCLFCRGRVVYSTR